MAKGRRGERRQLLQKAGQQAGVSRVSRKRARRGGSAAATDAELPTAAPGSAGTPGGGASSIVGGGAVQVQTGAGASRGVLRRRNRGGPRSLQERERANRGLRARVSNYDFRYVRSDLRWIAGTSVAATGAVLGLWAVIRL
jgi:hypothetical protein